jgi:hypothetical protein
VSDPSPAIFQRWGHSREEDTGDLTVYRPDSFEFPPARGRRGIEFHADGGFVYWEIGPGDGGQPVPGRWEPAGPRQVRLIYDGDARPPQLFEIAEADEEVLKVRQLGEA